MDTGIKLRIVSPLVNPDIRQVSMRLETILGDSSLLLNIALFHSQGIIYVTPEELQQQAMSFADSLSNDMLYHYQLLVDLKNQELRDCVYRDVYYFLSKSSEFFKNSHQIFPIIMQMKTRNMYMAVEKVFDGDSPYIDVSVRRG